MLPPSVGDVLALVRTKRKPVNGPLLVRRAGKVYELSQSKIKVPTLVAINMLGDSGLHVEFTADDKNRISKLSQRQLKTLAKGLNRPPDLKGIMHDLFPRSRQKKAIDVVKKAAPKKRAAVKKPTVKKVEEEKPELKPLLVCIECNEELTGKQQKFCSRKCSVNNKKKIKAVDL